nr:indolepyruvate oxidoreductase subunit beta [bacterium]
MNKLDLLLVGVGGQGTLLASRILGAYAVKMGLDVKINEVHGMAQRGGSVVTHVRMGFHVHAPLIDLGGADAIVSFEALEAARWLGYLAPGGMVVTNTQRIAPMPVITGQAAYPEGVVDSLKACANTVALDGAALALEAGDLRAVNCVLLGALGAKCGMDMAVLEQALVACVPPKTVEINTRALHMGAQAAQQA